MLTNQEKLIEETIRRAFWVDKQLPPVRLKTAQSPLGRVILLEDDRPISEIFAEKQIDKPTQDDLKTWEIVMFDWLPIVPCDMRTVVKRRCSGMGWKRITYELNISRSTAWRRFEDGIVYIKNHT